MCLCKGNGLFFQRCWLVTHARETILDQLGSAWSKRQFSNYVHKEQLPNPANISAKSQCSQRSGHLGLEQSTGTTGAGKQSKRPQGGRRCWGRGRSFPLRFHPLGNLQPPFWPMKSAQALQCLSLHVGWWLKTPHLCLCCQSPEAAQKLPAVLGACWHSGYPGRDQQPMHRMKQSP